MKNYPNLPEKKFQTQEYKRHLNDMLITNSRIVDAMMQDDYRKLQLYTILFQHQIEQGLEIVKKVDEGDEIQ
jgi:hypothetical protein